MTTETALKSSPPLQGERVAFTGTLASMTHRDAFAIVEKNGGVATIHVSRQTSMLVVGEEGWPLESDGRTSQKLQQAIELVRRGEPVRVIQESDWLQLLGLDEQFEDIRRACTPAMLSRMLDIPVGRIRRWARIGLIRPVRRVFRLPYFDYREVAGARRLAALLDSGISPHEIERSLTELTHSVSGSERSLTQLNLLVRDDRVLLRDRHGMLHPRTGQRFFDFGDDGSDLSFPDEDPSETEFDARDIDGDNSVTISFAEALLRREERGMTDWSADEWFHEGCRLAEEGALDSAVNAFRNCLSIMRADSPTAEVDQELVSSFNELFDADDRPDPADVQFQLADALYRAGAIDGAIERYYCAIEIAPDFIEAWTQLGCLMAEKMQYEEAYRALQTALTIHSDFPDAVYHSADVLEELGRTDEAVGMWQTYLDLETRGPWSDHARQRLQTLSEESFQETT